MNVRRRRIAARVARDARWDANSKAWHESMNRIQKAIDDALARGETVKTVRFMMEAFGCDEASAQLYLKGDAP